MGIVGAEIADEYVASERASNPFSNIRVCSEIEFFSEDSGKK